MEIDETEVDETEIEYQKMYIKINDFTKLLNKYGFEYQIKSFESGEGTDIILDKIIISFHLSGAIEFVSKKEWEE